MESTPTPGFPAKTTFPRRLGSKAQTVDRVRAWCEANSGSETRSGEPTFDYIYLLKSGPYYRVVRSLDVGRRGCQIRLQQPDEVEEVWKVRTDDPEGIEAYWHRRIADRHKNGEWFDLRKADVDASKRWKRIA